MSAPPALLNHDLLPSVANATLPARYEAAKVALAECARIDECQDWADRMAALASYARQAGDEEMRKYCMRIQDRAVRRCGELYNEIPAERGARTDLEPDEGDHIRLTARERAAKEAGLSEYQAVQAVRVAKVPEDEFEAAVESDNPPTVTALANLGRQPRETPKPLADLGGRDPDDFAAATPFISLPKEFLEEASSFDLERAWRGMNEDERAEARVSYLNCIAWITQAWEVLDGL